MKIDVDFTQDEYEALARIAKRFARTAKTRLKTDNVETLISEDDYGPVRTAMDKIARKCSDDGLYVELIDRHTPSLADYAHKTTEEPS